MNAETIHTYNQMAKEYDDETGTFWEEFPRTFIDEFANRVQGIVLDVGSGPGRDALLLESKGLQVTCLDASEEMIAFCTARGLTSVLGDYLSMPFEDDSFDGVWAYTSLLHVSKSEIGKALHEIRRVLKPGGFFGLGMIEGEGDGYREKSGIQLPRWFSFYTKEELEKLLHEHGFDVVYFEEFVPRTRNYLNFIVQKRAPVLGS